MDASFYIVTALICLAIAAGLGLLARWCFQSCKALDKLLKGAERMTGSATATISELVVLRRRNRSFRWTNEYPVLAYEVNGSLYKVHLPWAEARGGTYEQGRSVSLRYLPADPEQSIADEFVPKMKKSRSSYRIAAVLAGIFAFHLACSAIVNLLACFGL